MHVAAVAQVGAQHPRCAGDCQWPPALLRDAIAVASRSRRSPRPRGEPARGDHRHRAEARGEPAERADQHPGDRHREARGSCTSGLRRLRQVPAERRRSRRRRRSRPGLRAASYMRGVASGGDGNHSGPQPSVGMYLDEQPITTIPGSLDIHMYDIAARRGAGGSAGHALRRELAGRHDPHHHQQAGSDAASRRATTLEVNSVDHGGVGYVPRASSTCRCRDKAAVRLVGWYEHDAGYIDNVAERVPTIRTPRPTATGRPASATRRRLLRAALDTATRQEQLQRRRHLRRARGAQDRPQRQLVDYAVTHGPEAKTRTASSASTRRSAT